MAPSIMAKRFLSKLTGETVNQDHNTAKNLSYWPELIASTDLVKSSAPKDTQAVTDGGTDRGSNGGMTRYQRSEDKTRHQTKASRSEARIEPDDRQAKKLEGNVA